MAEIKFSTSPQEDPKIINLVPNYTCVLLWLGTYKEDSLLVHTTICYKKANRTIASYNNLQKASDIKRKEDDRQVKFFLQVGLVNPPRCNSQLAFVLIVL